MLPEDLHTYTSFVFANNVQAYGCMSEVQNRNIPGPVLYSPNAWSYTSRSCILDQHGFHRHILYPHIVKCPWRYQSSLSIGLKALPYTHAKSV